MGKVRRGPKSNPFVVGEAVQYKGSTKTGKVLKRDASELNWNEPRGYAPIEYLIEHEDGTTKWVGPRDLESIDARYLPRKAG